MSNTRYHIAVYSFILLFSSSHLVSSRIIDVPHEAASVQEAVEMAESGDEIVLSASHVSFAKIIGVEVFEFPEEQIRKWNIYDDKGVDIINKNLIIRGMSTELRVVIDNFYYSEDKSRIRIENSELTFENIQIDEPRNRPQNTLNRELQWIFKSGTLRLKNCHLISSFSCNGNLYVENCDIQGYAWIHDIPYTDYTGFDPAFLIGSADSVTIQFTNSHIHGSSIVSYRSIDIYSLNNSKINFSNCLIEGGMPKNSNGNIGVIQGSTGISVYQCTNTIFTIKNTNIIGSRGSDGAFLRFYVTGGGGGGDGIFISESEIELCIDEKSTIRGGNGGNGMIYRHEENHPLGGPIVLNGGNGGSGINLVNSYVVDKCKTLLEDIVIESGHGGGIRILDVYEVVRTEEEERLLKESFGVEDGKPGNPIFLDEFSKIIYASTVQYWELYP